MDWVVQEYLGVSREHRLVVFSPVSRPDEGFLNGKVSCRGLNEAGLTAVI